MATPQTTNTSEPTLHPSSIDPTGATANSTNGATPSTTNTNTSQQPQEAIVLLKTNRKKPSKPPSPVWGHFTKIKDDKHDPRARCNYCEKEYASGSKKNGTSNLWSHLAHQCPKYPNRENKKQKTLGFKPKKCGEGFNLVAKSYSAEACRDIVAKMIIIDEFPFRFVENEGCKLLCSVFEPRFSLPSRTTVARDCLNLFLKEKKMLMETLVKTSQRVCLTIDTWTSLQNLNYMCLTAHYIDSEWKLHKKILNFCQVPNHKGDTIGKTLEKCLLGWGIEKVFTVTVDTASSNDLAVAYLSKKVNNWGGAILGG